jgi:hypothetical protein
MVAKKLWVIMVVGLLLVGIAGMCYGEDTRAPQAPQPPQRVQGAPPPDQGKINEEFGKALDELIAVKVITAEQKGKLIEYFEKALKDAKPMDLKAMGEPQKGNDPISLLVKDGFINQDQAAVIARVLPRPMPMGMGQGPGPERSQIPPDPGRMKADLQKKLDELVNSKVITDKQKDIILKYSADNFDRMKDQKPGAGAGKDKGMKGEGNDLLSLLVKSGVITQKQADAIDAISEAMPRPMPMQMEKGCGPDRPQAPLDPEKMKAELQKKLDELVGSKVITDQQKVAVMQFFSDDFDKMKGQKPGAEPGKAGDLKGERKDPLGLLVKDGVITQQQADAIAKGLFQFPAPMDKRDHPEHPQP